MISGYYQLSGFYSIITSRFHPDLERLNKISPDLSGPFRYLILFLT